MVHSMRLHISFKVPKLVFRRDVCRWYMKCRWQIEQSLGDLPIVKGDGADVSTHLSGPDSGFVPTCS